MRGWLIPFLIVIYHSTLLSTSVIAQPTQVPSASQQIAAAILPLPEVMRDHATVLGYAPDLSLITLREGTNGMVCTASRPGDAEFDVRCYHESFMPVVRRMRDLRSRGLGVAHTPAPIVSIFPRATKEVATMRQRLLSHGVFPSFIRYPGGPKSGYFRFVVSSEHSQPQLDDLLAGLSP